MKRAVLVFLVALSYAITPGFSALSASLNAHYMQLGCRLVRFDHLPVVQVHEITYISLAVLDELTPTATVKTSPGSGAGKPLGGRSEGQDEEPDEQSGNASPPQVETINSSREQIKLLPVPAALVPPAAGMKRYKLAGHALDVAQAGQPYTAELDNKPLASAALLEYNGRRYIQAEQLAGTGLLLGYNSTEDLYQLNGLIYRIDLATDEAPGRVPSLTLTGMTPLRLDGAQGEDGVVTLIANGGFLADTAAREYGGSTVVSKVGLKTQPELGRTYLFVKQPRRTGFKIASDQRAGFARISFGNYFQVASYNKSSSGEISLNVQLGAASQVHDELLDAPPRLVLDFAGAVFDEASQTLKVNQSRVRNIRIGQPEPGTVRVVLDLSERLDYRILPDDGGARYYIQLLPRTEVNALPAQRRLGRTIMVDAGHGGSDPGAPGVIDGVWEAPINLRISQAVAEELRQMGYEVLLTRRSDRFTSLGARSDYANSVLPYLFVSIHCNSIEKPDFQGLMTFHHPTSYAGTRLANDIHSAVLDATGAVDKGVRTANFFVLRETVMPSVLVECGFLTNAEECRKLASPQYQRVVAQGIARGIDRYITGAF